QKADTPLTPYAASKKSMETMAHSYAHLWNIPTTILRFFTVYGPWGRPDMAPSKFVRNILDGQPIAIYNHGRVQRDFTYIDDLADAVIQLINKIPRCGVRVGDIDSLSPVAPYRIVNIGGHRPVGVLEFLDQLEKALGTVSKRDYVDMQSGDVTRTD